MPVNTTQNQTQYAIQCTTATHELQTQQNHTQVHADISTGLYTKWIPMATGMIMMH